MKSTRRLIIQSLGLSIISIYTIGKPSYANEPSVTAVANPQATSTGSVTNQAVQVLQGPYITNSFGGGVQCQGPTLNITPFLVTTVSGQWPYEAYAQLDGEGGTERTGQKNSWSFNPGISATVSIPLDGNAQDLCRQAATAHTERVRAETAKARLDFELVRLLRCGEAMKAGVYFHPDSPYARVCADVVVAGVPQVVSAGQPARPPLVVLPPVPPAQSTVAPPSQ